MVSNTVFSFPSGACCYTVPGICCNHPLCHSLKQNCIMSLSKMKGVCFKTESQQILKSKFMYHIHPFSLYAETPGLQVVHEYSFLIWLFIGWTPGIWSWEAVEGFLILAVLMMANSWLGHRQRWHSSINAINLRFSIVIWKFGLPKG